MKANFFKLIPLACMLAASASAGVYTIASGDNSGFGNQIDTVNLSQTNKGNSNGGPTSASYNVAPVPAGAAWANIRLDNQELVAGNAFNCGSTGFNCAKWVSFVSSNSPGSALPNTTNASNGFVDFIHTFTLDAAVTSASLKLLADDRANIYITNGSGIESEIYVTASGGSNGPCNLAVIGCTVANAFNSSLRQDGVTSIASALSAGTNSIRVRVYQTNSSGFGTAYLANITTVPEPGFYGLLSIGVGALLFRARRRAA